MSSYNFLKAVGDGLAEAINYRTNLKRKRRENEYDYQRDLQRQRDEEAYNRQRDLQWDQENYDIKQKRAKKKKQEDIQEAYDFLNNKYFGKELNTPQQIQDFNFEAIASQQPFSVALPKKDTFAQQIALEDYKQKNRIALQQAKNAAKGGSGRQPSLTPYEKLQHDLSMAKTPEEREMILQLHRVAPRSVKGGSGDSDDFDPYKYAKDYQEKIYKATGDYLNFVGPDKAKYAESLWNIERDKNASAEGKKKATEELNKIFEEEVAAGKREMAQILAMRKMWSNTAHDSLMFKTNGKFGFDPNTNEVILMENALKQGDQAIAEIRAMKNAALQGASNPSIMGGQNVYPQQASGTINLYSENPQIATQTNAMVSAPETMPTDIKPLSVVPASGSAEIVPNSVSVPKSRSVNDIYQDQISLLKDQYWQGAISRNEYVQRLAWLNNEFGIPSPLDSEQIAMIKRAYNSGQINRAEYLKRIEELAQ